MHTHLINFKLLLTIVSLVLATTTNFAYAQSEDRPNNLAIEKGVAFVNLSKIFKDSSYVQAKREEIAEEFMDQEKVLEEKIKLLQADKEDLTKNRLTMTSAQIQDATDALNAREIEIKRETRDLTDDKRLRFDAAQRELETLVLEKIKEVSRNRENFIVFDLSTILFADARLEITDEVIKLIDEELATSP